MNAYESVILRYKFEFFESRFLGYLGEYSEAILTGLRRMGLSEYSAPSFLFDDFFHWLPIDRKIEQRMQISG